MSLKSSGCAGVAQLVEQLICNQQVAGSSPIASSSGSGQRSSNGEMAEWLKAADCKSAGLMTYGGSNPPLSTNVETRRQKPETRKRPVLVSGFEFLVSTAGVTQLVESQPSKLLVAGSSPVSRSRFESRRQKAEGRSEASREAARGSELK